MGRAHVCVRAACPLHFPISRVLPTRCQYRSASLQLHIDKAEGRQRNIYVCSALSLCFILNIWYTIRMGPPVVSKGIPMGNIAIKSLGAGGCRAPGCRRPRVVPAVPPLRAPNSLARTEPTYSCPARKQPRRLLLLAVGRIFNCQIMGFIRKQQTGLGFFFF